MAITRFLTILLLLASLTGSVFGAHYNCEAPDSKEVKGTCLIKGVVINSAEEIDKVSFQDDGRSGSLTMADGNITTFTKALAQKLPKVKDLTVDGMNIRMCVIWPSLEHLSAQNNSIESVGFTVADEQFQLRTLHLHNNALASVPSFGKRFKQLKVLVLDGNMLETVSLDSFTHLTQLQTLSIARNRVIHVMASEHLGLASVQLLKLKHLSLAGNRLLTLNVSGWEMESLESLDLSGNDLYLLDVPQLGHLKALKELQYAGNDWNCEWLSAMQLYLRDKMFSVSDRDVSGRCEREKMTSLQGICCYEPAEKDFSMDLFADRWEQLNELQRRYDLVKFAYDEIEEADLNAFTGKVQELRGQLAGPAAGAQDEITSTLHRLRSIVVGVTARMDQLKASVNRTVVDVRQSIEELYQRSIRPKPTLDAVHQQTIAESLSRIQRNIEQLRRRIQDYVFEINVGEKIIRKLDERIISFERKLTELKGQNQVLYEQVKSIEENVHAAYQLIDSSMDKNGYYVNNPVANYRTQNVIAKYRLNRN